MNEEHSEPAAKKRRKDAEKVVPTGKDNGPPEGRPVQRYEDTAKDKSITPEQLGGMLEKIADAVNGILEKAREQIAESLDNFAQKLCGRTLSPVFQIYESNFISHGIKSKGKLEHLCSLNYRYEKVRDGYEYLQEAEEDWDKLMKSVEHKFEDEISQAGGRVVVVSLADPEGAEVWLSQMNCSFDLVLDRQRDMYQAFDFRRSISQVWEMKIIDWYVEQHVAGRGSFKASKEDDVYQLGGDVLMGKDGRVLLVHRSENSLDRPDIQTVLKLMKEDQQKTS